MIVQQTLTQLRNLGLDGMAHAFEEQITLPSSSGLSFEDRFAMLVEREAAHRNDRRLTRLLAIFHSQDVPVIGPIRSARPVDADILHLLGHSYFAFSGGTSSDLGPINDHSNATPMWWVQAQIAAVAREE